MDDEGSESWELGQPVTSFLEKLLENTQGYIDTYNQQIASSEAENKPSKVSYMKVSSKTPLAKLEKLPMGIDTVWLYKSVTEKQMKVISKLPWIWNVKLMANFPKKYINKYINTLPSCIKVLDAKGQPLPRAEISSTAEMMSALGKQKSKRLDSSQTDERPSKAKKPKSADSEGDDQVDDLWGDLDLEPLAKFKFNM